MLSTLLKKCDTALGTDPMAPNSLTRLWGRHIGWDSLGFRFDKHVVGLIIRLHFKPGQRVTTSEMVATYDSNGKCVGISQSWTRRGTVLSISKGGSGHYGVDVRWDTPHRLYGHYGWAGLSHTIPGESDPPRFPWWIRKGDRYSGPIGWEKEGE